ncbi:MAG: PAS domain-containing protein [Planctomycetes bacterium]|nr:PAS domain-containing protein [Planctomycetota bacterium]
MNYDQESSGRDQDSPNRKLRSGTDRHGWRANRPIRADQRHIRNRREGTLLGALRPIVSSDMHGLNTHSKEHVSRSWRTGAEYMTDENPSGKLESTPEATVPSVGSSVDAADLRRILQLSPASIFIVDCHGRTRFANRAASELFGRPIEQLHDHPFGLALNASGATEMDIVRPDGKTRIGEVHVARIVWNGLSASLVTIFDVTQRMMDELTIRQINEELTQRTRDMERFVFAASHDLKAPLVTIGGYTAHICEALQKTDMELVGKFVERVKDAASRMRRHVDDLLEVCRAGHPVEARSQVDLGEAARQVVRERQDEICRRQASVIIHEPMPTVDAVPSQMLQVFDNLLGNALRYGCKGPDRRIEIRGERQAYQVSFCVRDYGPGIDPQHAQTVFELFKKLGDDREGSGVGLTIVQRIAEWHGGKVWLESPTDHGAAFWVSLPCRAPMA